MGILILDPVKQQAEEDAFRQKVEAWQKSPGTKPYPNPPTPTEAELDYKRSIASSEEVYKNFTTPQFGMPPDEHKVLDESPEKLDDSFPSRQSFETGANTQPFKLKEK